MNASHALQRHVIELSQWSAAVRLYTKLKLRIAICLFVCRKPVNA